MSLCNHLQRRGSSGNYSFRVRIPSDLLDTYNPRKEIVFSLKTKEAKARCKVEASVSIRGVPSIADALSVSGNSKQQAPTITHSRH